MSEGTLNLNSTLIDAVLLIEKSVKRLAIVLSEDKRVIGTLTDGDIRRCLLLGGTLDTLVGEGMNQSPVIANVNSSDHLLKKLLHKKKAINSMSLFFRNLFYCVFGRVSAWGVQNT